ncbi:AAA family ATPase [uncultured Methanobrevibacter sp.]|uniref:AAA family ATPase n=1 Tax=uncultured Methanobrevibacter sp. TaxID=253161 RepID=UPI0025E2A680|nr:AAA family ATPase [uncultured Methanobrevibacter sp.]
MENIWILPAGKGKNVDKVWDSFKKESYVGIESFGEEDKDFRDFKSKKELEFLKKNNNYAPNTVWTFVNVIKKGDFIIIRDGFYKFIGIGEIISDFIPQTESKIKNNVGFNNIRFVNWIYTPDDLEVNDKFSSMPLVDLNPIPYKWNFLLCSLSRNYDDLKKNIMNFLYDEFYNKFFKTEKGMNYSNEYDEKILSIKNTWEEISDKYNKNESISKDLWDNLFDCNVKIEKGEEISFKTFLNSFEYSDEEINNSRLDLFKIINKILNTKDINEQKAILKDYSSLKSSEVFNMALLSHILHCIDNSFYIIDDDTKFTSNFLNLMFKPENLIDDDLSNYMDNNIELKNFLNKLKQTYPYDDIDILDFKTFYMFCHWMCEKDLGHYATYWHYADKKINRLPTKLLEKTGEYMNNETLNENKTFESTLKRNVIYFGAPGTGKSYNLNIDMKNLNCDYERVTFHPDYSYANFVGTYKPVPKGEDISYEYVPGPFMRSLVKALKNPYEPFLLIIEEINRANVAAVFGDVFQLLDRKSDNFSEYPIEATEDMKTYLKKELNEDFDKIRLPSNLFIWATMNSADQGVFPMDTAFKRRWDFKYFGINHDEQLVSNIKVEINNQVIYWNDLRKAINEELLTYKINEDKLLGPFFAFNEYLKDEIPLNEFMTTFKNKIIMYLFEDAARSKRNELFSGVSKKGNLTYSQICEAFDETGIEIFCDNIKEKFIIEEE